MDTKWWAYWETYTDSGRPSALFIGQGEPRWEKSPDILPFAMGDFAIVGEDFTTEEAAREAADEMIRVNEDGWVYFK